MVSEMKDSVETARKLSSLDMLVNVMYNMLMGVDILQEEIDQELNKVGEHFHFEKRQAFNKYKKLMQDAYKQYEKFGVTDSIWEATGENANRFDDFRADANELLRMIVLYVDRAHYVESFYKIFRFLRSLPPGGLFTEEDVERFEFKRPWVCGKGDRVRSQLFGDGTLEMNTNGDNWLVNFDDGMQRILRENQFKQI